VPCACAARASHGEVIAWVDDDVDDVVIACVAGAVSRVAGSEEEREDVDVLWV
jgi:hypothetical protein